MGNKTYLNGQKLKEDNFDKYFQLKLDVNDVRFGDGRIFQSKEERDVDVLVVCLPNIRQQQNVQVQIQGISDKNHLVTVYGNQMIEQKGLCGSQNKLRIVLEYVPQTLKQFIYQNRTQHKRLRDQELIHIVNKIAGSIHQLDTMYSYHGNINQDTISRTADDLFVLYDNMLLTGLNTEARKINGDHKVIVAPELFPIINAQSSEILLDRIDREKVDIYQLGIVALQLLFNKDLMKLIEINDKQQLESELNSLFNNLDHKILEIVQKMVCIDPSQRLNSRQVIEQTEMLAYLYMRDQHQEMHSHARNVQKNSDDLNQSQNILNQSQNMSSNQYQSLGRQEMNYQSRSPIQQTRQSQFNQVNKSPIQQPHIKQMNNSPVEQNIQLHTQQIVRSPIQQVKKFPIQQSRQLHIQQFTQSPINRQIGTPTKLNRQNVVLTPTHFKSSLNMNPQIKRVYQNQQLQPQQYYLQPKNNTPVHNYYSNTQSNSFNNSYMINQNREMAVRIDNKFVRNLDQQNNRLY